MIQMGNICEFVIISMLSLGIVSGQQCTQLNIADCVRPFMGYDDPAELTEPILNAACSYLSNVSVCITNIGCLASDREVKAAWTGTQDSYNYFCGRKSDVLSKVTCWKNDTLKSIVKSCPKEYVKPLSPEDSDPESGPEDTCVAMNGLLPCIRTGLTSRCGADSADLYVTFVYKQLSPYIKAHQTKCTLNDLSGSSPRVAISASFITVLLASSALLLMF